MPRTLEGHETPWEWLHSERSEATVSGHTLKGSQNPGEADATISRCGGSEGTENLRSQPSGKAEEGPPNQTRRYVLRVNPLEDRATPREEAVTAATRRQRLENGRAPEGVGRAQLRYHFFWWWVFLAPTLTPHGSPHLSRRIVPRTGSGASSRQCRRTTLWKTFAVFVLMGRRKPVDTRLKTSYLSI